MVSDEQNRALSISMQRWLIGRTPLQIVVAHELHVPSSRRGSARLLRRCAVSIAGDNAHCNGEREEPPAGSLLRGMISLAYPRSQGKSSRGDVRRSGQGRESTRGAPCSSPEPSPSAVLSSSNTRTSSISESSREREPWPDADTTDEERPAEAVPRFLAQLCQRGLKTPAPRAEGIADVDELREFSHETRPPEVEAIRPGKRHRRSE